MGVTHKAATWSRSSEAECDLFVAEVGVHQKDTEEGQESFGQVEAPPQQRRAVIRVESAGTQDYVSALPLKCHLDQKMEAEDEENMEEPSSVPSAFSETRRALHMCDNKCGAKGFKFFEIAALVSDEGGAARTINFCRKCYNERRLKQGEEGVNGVKWRAMIEQKSPRGKLWAAFGVGPDRSRQM